MENSATVSISESNFESEVTQSDKPVLLDFWAEWCGPCKMIAPILDEIAKEKAGAVKVGKVNITVQVKDSFGVLVGKTFQLDLFPANEAPVAHAQNVVASKNTALTLTLDATDSNGDPLTYSVAVSPIHGSLSGTPPNLVYMPNSGVTGADSFFFKASDGVLDSLPAKVTITINDEPIRFISSSAQGEQFKAIFKGAIARDYTVEVSSDLKTWTGTGNKLNTTGTITYTDAVLSNQSKFYRARLVP